MFNDKNSCDFLWTKFFLMYSSQNTEEPVINEILKWTVFGSIKSK